MLLYDVLAMLKCAAKGQGRSVLMLCLVLKLSSGDYDKSTSACTLAWEVSSFVRFGFKELDTFIFSKCVNLELRPSTVCMQSAHPRAFVQYLVSLTSLIRKTQRNASSLSPRCKQTSLSNSVSADWQLTRSVFLPSICKTFCFPTAN